MGTFDNRPPKIWRPRDSTNLGSLKINKKADDQSPKEKCSCSFIYLTLLENSRIDELQKRNKACSIQTWKLPMEISSDFLTALCVEAIHGLDGLQQIPTYHTNSHEIDRILTTPVLKFG